MPDCFIMEKKLDKNVTIHVENKELERLIQEHAKNRSADSLNRLLNHLVTRRVLIPALKGEDPHRPMPCLLQAPNGEKIFPVFTSLEQTKNAPPSQGIINMPVLAVVNTVVQAGDALAGIAINPFSDNLILKSEMIKRIAEVEAMKKAGVTREVAERMRFEKGFLPKRLFQEGKQFLKDLDERRETYLDVLFEESYQQKRMYPYVEEDFSVMMMTISDDILVARVEFPNKDIAQGVSLRAFLVWNDAIQQARYFSIDVGRGGNVFVEVTDSLSIHNWGPAPIEGTELQRVVDMARENESTGCTS